MNRSWLAVGLALSFAAYSQFGLAQINQTATGGAGGQGGSAAGGSAAGGSATGGAGGSAKGGAGGTSSAEGGAASASGGTVTGVSTGAITSSGTGNSQAAEVTVNYIQPSSPGGIKGLAAGVDPETNHFVNDNNVRYSGSQTIKNTPDVSVGGPASGPCNGFSGGIGVSVPGFAIGANASTVDKGCEARETARIAAMLGRMDIANAVLEHIGVVEEALKAKAEREAAKKAAINASPPAQTAPAAQRQQPKQPAPSEADAETARLAEQQKLASATFQRKATMEKVNDTFTFTTGANQEKTPQQTMAEEAAQQQAELAARAEKQALAQQGIAQPADPAPAAVASQQPSSNVSAPASAPALANATAPQAAPQPVANNSASAVIAAAASNGGAAVQQPGGGQQPQQRSPASVDSTASGGQATGVAASVASAQPSVSGDQVRKLLGLAVSPATRTASTPASTADERPANVVARDGTGSPWKADASSSPSKAGAAKGPSPDPLSIAKMLNVNK